MNYKKIYDSLIINSKLKNLETNKYYERHHIVPKCMGGSNKKINIVKLTAREHFIAHQLLIKIYPNNRFLIQACLMMCVTNNKEVIRNNRLYEWIRIRWAKNQSEYMILNNPRKIIDKTKEAERIKRQKETYFKNKKLGFHPKKFFSEKVRKDRSDRMKRLKLMDNPIYRENLKQRMKFNNPMSHKEYREKIQKQLSFTQINDIICLYDNGYGIESIYKKTKHSPSVIKRVLNDNNIKIRNNVESKKAMKSITTNLF